MWKHPLCSGQALCTNIRHHFPYLTVVCSQTDFARHQLLEPQHGGLCQIGLPLTNTDPSGNAARMGRVVGLVVRRQRVTLTGHRLAIAKDIRAGGYHRGRWKAIVVGSGC
jgi:hypothetical protein